MKSTAASRSDKRCISSSLRNVTQPTLYTPEREAVLQQFLKDDSPWSHLEGRSIKPHALAVDRLLDIVKPQIAKPNMDLLGLELGDALLTPDGTGQLF